MSAVFCQNDIERNDKNYGKKDYHITAYYIIHIVLNSGIFITLLHTGQATPTVTFVVEICDNTWEKGPIT